MPNRTKSYGLNLTQQMFRVLNQKTRQVLSTIGFHTRPSFIIIGAQKAGTTALWNYLVRHTDIVPPVYKELRFFNVEKRYTRGYNWYHSHFPLPNRFSSNFITFEATPAYFYSKKAPERVSRYDADIKLILLLRDPVSRAYSAWFMYKRMFKDNKGKIKNIARDANDDVRRWFETRLKETEQYPSFEEAFEWEVAEMDRKPPVQEPSWFRRGLYCIQLNRYLQYFNQEQILIIDSNRLLEETVDVLGEVTRFLGLKPYDWSQHKLNPIGVQKYDFALSPEIYQRLHDFYAPYNTELRQISGMTFSWM